MIEFEIRKQIIGFARLLEDTPDDNNPELVDAYNDACEENYQELKDAIFLNESKNYDIPRPIDEVTPDNQPVPVILTQSEYEVLKSERKIKAERKAKEKLINKCLGIANEYKEWLRENNKVATETNFLYQFKYDGEIGRTPEQVYGIVKRILDRAEELVD